jgi:hypothetical protein
MHVRRTDGSVCSNPNLGPYKKVINTNAAIRVVKVPVWIVSRVSVPNRFLVLFRLVLNRASRS